MRARLYTPGHAQLSLSSVIASAANEMSTPAVPARAQQTAACKELIEQAEAIQQAREEGRPIPDFRPKTEEEKMARAGGPPAVIPRCMLRS